jgi:penicillin-binding protein 1A
MQRDPLQPDYVRPPDGHRHRFLLLIIPLFALLVPLGLFTWLWVWALHGVHFPSPDQITSRRIVSLETADGRPLLPKGLLQLPPVAVKNLPPNVINAVLSTEDRHFYEHGAVDMWSILRALKQNIEAGHIVSGASTITQQLAKMLYLNPQRTYKRKIQEAAIAFWLQMHLTKDQILTSYLNNVYLGSGATGFSAAAKFYFGENVSQLNLPQAAMLAGMINAPVEDDPLHNPVAAQLRAAAVLDAMVANSKISRQAAIAAKLNPATPNPAPLAPPSTGWFADWAYRKAIAAIPALAGAVRVRTTLDLRLQKLASNIVKSTLATYGRQLHATQAALVAMRPDGAVVAMVGGRNYLQSQFNRAVRAKRQPGSAFKLFDYYAALRRGFTPDDNVLDAPIDIKGWEPENYGRRYHGRVTLAAAFAHSYNAATVRLSQEIGIPQVIAAARDLGLHARLADNPSLALGTSEVTLLDLTGAYAAVRAGAAPVEPWAIASVGLSNERLVVPIGRPHEPRHSLGQYQNELINLLQGVVQHGTGRAAALPGFAAGKTGTTQDYRDAWFIGFNDSLVVGVWVGNDDDSPTKRVVGGTLPAAIWKRFMEQANPAPSTMVVAQQQTDQKTPTSPQQMSPVAKRQPRAINKLFNQNITGAASASCNIPVCERYYRSFRASDCTYQPLEGGVRRFCDRQVETREGVSGGGSERPAPTPSTANRNNAGGQPRSPNGQKTIDQDTARRTAHDTANAAPGAASRKCNIAACQRYSSFHASDCTYQPYGGGSRRPCDGHPGERTASTPSRERGAPAAPAFDSRRADSFADSSDRDGPSAPRPFFGPMFDWESHDQ